MILFLFYSLGKLQTKIWKSVRALEYFTTNEWRFSCENTTALYAELSPEDKDVFNFDAKQIDWAQYLHNYYNGVKTYVLKEHGEKSNINT